MTAIICTVGSGLPAFADIGVTTAARMIEGSDTIFVGHLAVERGHVVAIRERDLKGHPLGDKLPLIDPSEGGFLAFDLTALVNGMAGTQTLVLGEFDRPSGGLRLKWLSASFWPQSYRPSTFPSETVAQSAAFVEHVLGFSHLAHDPDLLAAALYADISGAGDQPPHAAIAYLEVAVERDLPAPLPMLLRSLGAAAAARNGRLDRAALEELTTLAPDMPASILAPLSLRLMNGAPPESAKLLKNTLWPMLSARGAAVGPDSTPAALEHGLTPLLPALRRADATRALAAYGTGLARFQSDFGDMILEAILGRLPNQPLKGLGHAARLGLWKQVIAALN